MQVMTFDTANIAEPVRLATFRAAAHEFRVDPIGDPAAFSQRWRMLKLGDLNVIHVHGSALHYQRDLAMIMADGEDRLTIHCYLSGATRGTIDGRGVDISAPDAVIWDLAAPLDMRSSRERHEMIIVTLPRYLIDEVLPAPSLAGALPASPELALAVVQARRLIDDAANIPDAAALFLSRALRDMFAVAMLPAYRAVRPMARPDAPLLQRINDFLDARLSAEPDAPAVAAALEVTPEDVAKVADHFGGLALLAERRRLLAAYRLLCDPGETATVELIAHRCGFSSVTGFSRRFSSVFRTSARDLRRHGRGHLPPWAGAYHVEHLYGAMLSS